MVLSSAIQRGENNKSFAVDADRKIDDEIIGYESPTASMIQDISLLPFLLLYLENDDSGRGIMVADSGRGPITGED